MWYPIGNFPSPNFSAQGGLKEEVWYRFQGKAADYKLNAKIVDGWFHFMWSCRKGSHSLASDLFARYCCCCCWGGGGGGCRSGYCDVDNVRKCWMCQGMSTVWRVCEISEWTHQAVWVKCGGDIRSILCQRLCQTCFSMSNQSVIPSVSRKPVQSIKVLGRSSVQDVFVGLHGIAFSKCSFGMSPLRSRVSLHFLDKYLAIVSRSVAQTRRG